MSLDKTEQVKQITDHDLLMNTPISDQQNINDPEISINMTPNASYLPVSSTPEQRVETDQKIRSPARPSKNKKFSCQFDPSIKNGRSLVLKFDTSGNPIFQEMSRLDVLRMAHEAAQPMEDKELKDNKNISDTPAMAVKIMRRPMRKDSLNGMEAFGTICDVQLVHARDIRKLDNAFAVSNEPSIVLRKQAILMNADPIRAVIMRDACLVFVPDGADSLLSILKEKFKENTQLENAETPFELMAIEALLASICKYFERDYEKTAPIVSNTLDRLANGRNYMKELEVLRVFKNTINEFESQVDGVRRCLMELLDNEEDMRLLYLTKLHENPSLLNDLWSFDSEEAEVLVENYLQDIVSIRTKASLLQHRIQNTESLVMLKLDSIRNYLLGVDLMFSLTAVCVALGTFITGIFGMNLNSGLEEAGGVFWGLVISTGILLSILVIGGLFFFQTKGIFLF